MDVEDDSFQEVNLMEQLNNLHLDDDDDTDKFADNRNEFEPQANVPLNEASKNVFNKSNPVFSSNYKSSKVFYSYYIGTFNFVIYFGVLFVDCQNVGSFT